MYKYPYGNTQQLNLDWMLGEWKAFKESFFNMVAPAWDDKTPYTAGAVVINDETLYRAKTTPTTGVFDKTQWDIIAIADLMEV